MGKAVQAQAGRDRARDARLKAARERRLKLDPEQLARERRIDEASVDVEVAWEERAHAEQALADAELAAAAAIELRKQIQPLFTGTIRRCRHLKWCARP